MLFESIYSQQPTMEWVTRFHTAPFSKSLCTDETGNLFISGAAMVNTVYRTHFLTIKYNSSGVIQWNRVSEDTSSFSGSSSFAYKNVCDGSGNVYAAGRTSNYIYGSDILIIKYSSNGDSLWSARYNGPGNADDELTDMEIDKFSNIYLTGWSYGTPYNTEPNVDYVTIKYDFSGNRVWALRYNNFAGSTDRPVALSIDSSQNIYVTGYCENSFGGIEYVTIKYNNSGVQQWVAKYNSDYLEATATSITVDKEQNIYVTGHLEYFIMSDDNYITIKYNPDGQVLWQKEFTYYAPGDDIPNEIFVDSLLNVYICGTSIVKYNSDGVFQWADTNTNPRSDYGAIDNKGNFYAIFYSDGIGTPVIKTVKYKTDGIKAWSVKYYKRNDTVSQPSGIIINRNNDIFISGDTYVINTPNTDSIILIKYSQPIGINDPAVIVPGSYLLYQNYPNPFNPTTKIRFALPISPQR